MQPRPLIRRLGRSDITDMRALNDLFGRAFDERETYSAEPPTDEYLERLLSQSHVITLGAFAAETVVGGLVAYELDKFERMRREVYIYDLAVEEQYRRCGIATSLIEQLRTIASERDAYVIYVQADYGDDPAIRLYESLGVRENVMHFDIPVPKKG